jgi:hypothetical protein
MRKALLVLALASLVGAGTFGCSEKQTPVTTTANHADNAGGIPASKGVQTTPAPEPVVNQDYKSGVGSKAK